MRVTLNVFSGRPNPGWELSQEQISEFLKKILKLKTQEDSQLDSSENGLGYRGLIVEEADFSQKSRRFEIYNGIINVAENESSNALEDKECSIERWLLQTAPESLDDIVKYVMQEIEYRLAKSKS